MNAKLAKTLRAAAGYKNQSSTPGTMPFPGISRKMVRHPVYLSHVVERSEYVPAGGGRWKKILRKVKRMVHSSFEKPTLKMVSDVNVPGGFRPDEMLVPVTNPGRLDERQPKGIYRALKSLAKRGTLQQTAEAIIAAGGTVPA